MADAAAFDPEAYLEAKSRERLQEMGANFDPDSYLKSKGVTPARDVTLNDVANGFNDNFQRIGRHIPVAGPAMVKIGNTASALIDAAMPHGAGQGDTYLDRANDAYDKYSALDQKHEADFAAAHPHINLQEKMAGTMLAPMLPGGAGGEAALARIAGSGAMTGADAAIRGESTADTAKGAGMASGLQAVLESIPYVGTALSNSIGSKVEDFANRKAFKSLEPDLAAETRNRNKWVPRTGGAYPDEDALIPQSEAIGQRLRDEGVIGFGAGVKGMNARAEALKDAAGEQIGAQLKSADDYVDQLAPQIGQNFRISPVKLADEIENGVAKEMKGNFSAQSDLNSLKGHLDNLRSENIAGTEAEPTTWTLSEANAQKSDIGKKIKEWNKLPPERRPADQAAYETIYHALNDQIETKMANLDRLKDMYGDKGLELPPNGFSQPFEEAKARFGPAAEAEKITDKAIARNERNRSMSLTSYLTGGAAGTAAAAKFGPVVGGAVGLAGAVGNMAVKHRGNATLSALAGGGVDLMQSLKTNPEAFGRFAPTLLQAAQRGPSALAVTHFVMSQRDPDYQRLQQDTSP